MFYENDFLSDMEEQVEEAYEFDATMGTNYSGFFPEHEDDDNFDEDEDDDF